MTVCTLDKERLFGDVVDGELAPSEAGRIVAEEWAALTKRFRSIELDDFVVMPNRLHGIIRIRTSRGAASSEGPASSEGAASGAPTLGEIVRAFKSISACAVNKVTSRPGRQVWQRNYYERVVRDEGELNRIREYIGANPLRWASDRENPEVA